MHFENGRVKIRYANRVNMFYLLKNDCQSEEWRNWFAFWWKKVHFCLCVRRKYCLSVLVLKEWCINCREREKKLAELRSLKSDFKPGVWNVNAVLLGGLGKEPEVDGKELPVCSLLLPAIKRCLKISFWFCCGTLKPDVIRVKDPQKVLPPLM